MQTGEGKTLAAVMPAALNALAGRGVHVLTFNDYLARRDAEWMGPVYAMLGLTVGHVQQGMSPRSAGAAYHADVTYVTAKEAGFDHLRDLLAHRPGGPRAPAVSLRARRRGRLDPDRRGHGAARDCRAAGRAGVESAPAGRASSHRCRPVVHFDTDEYGRNVDLTDAGHRTGASDVLGAGACTTPATSRC